MGVKGGMKNFANKLKFDFDHSWPTLCASEGHSWLGLSIHSCIPRPLSSKARKPHAVWSHHSAEGPEHTPQETHCTTVAVSVSHFSLRVGVRIPK